jgi:hypothetical protein
MKTVKAFKNNNSFETRQALGILAVDNIKVSKAGLDILKAREEGKISYQEAVQSIVTKAKKYGAR